MTDTVTRATNIFSLATKNSCLVATLVTRFLYDLDLNLKLKQIFHLPNRITKASLPLLLSASPWLVSSVHCRSFSHDFAVTYKCVPN